MEANQIMVKMVLDRWYSLLKVFDTILDSVSDEKLEKEPRNLFIRSSYSCP